MIDVKNLSVEFGHPDRPVRAVRDASMKIERGVIHGLIGESGCGKSTIGMAFLGLLPDDARVFASRCRFGETDLVADAARLRGRRISLISQDPAAALNPVLSIRRQLDDVLKAAGHTSSPERKARSAELLDATGLPDSHRVLRSYPHELSGGMQQRAVIAQALATGAEFLIADEPTSALDKTIGRQVLDVLKALVDERNLTILMITHDMDVVAYACSRASVLYAGMTVEEAETRALLASPKHPYTRALLGARPGRNTMGLRLEAIAGQPPRPDTELAGCPFAERCSVAMPVCAERAPPRRNAFDRDWACHHEA